jgi:HEPN domain-containing protein
MNRYKEWIARAKCNFKYATMPIDEDMFYVEACYQAHQAIEKAFKGLLVFLAVEPELTHNIGILIDSIEKHIEVPTDIKMSIQLTKYAHKTRYPGDYVDVSIEEYEKVIAITRNCLNWVETVIINMYSFNQ